MNIYIVVLVWNGREVSEKCLDSLSRLSTKVTVVVVDNGSEDDTGSYLSKRFPQFLFLRNEKNLGFSGGVNKGINFALQKGADIVVVLNNDTEVDRSFLEPIVSCLNNDSKVGLVSPYIYEHGSNKLWFGGGKIILPFYRPVHSEGSLDFLSGCCLVVKREVFEKIGLFDERYFLYYEDVDFSLRARGAGFKLLTEPKSRVFHKVSYSSNGSASPKAVYYTVRNNLFLIKRFAEFPIKITSYLYVFILSVKIILWRFNKDINASVISAWKDFLQEKAGER